MAGDSRYSIMKMLGILLFYRMGLCVVLIYKGDLMLPSRLVALRIIVSLDPKYLCFIVSAARMFCDTRGLCVSMTTH